MTTNDTKRKSFTIRINSELDKTLDEKAKALGMSKNSIISMILHNEMKGRRQ